MSGLARYMTILRLFDDRKSEWTVPEISTALAVPTSTIYRTIRELVAHGLLEQATESYYRLGAAFVEFDRRVRLTDPLYQAGTSLLQDISLQSRVPCVAVLARLYGDTVMCIADAASADAEVHTSYERGRPRPLTQGATSKVILAQLTTRRLRRLLANDAFVKSRGSFPLSEIAFREELAMIRRQGFCVTRGEVDKGVVGIAAPVSVPEVALTASVSLVVPSSVVDDVVQRRLILLLVSSASLLVEDVRRLVRGCANGIQEVAGG
jgi:DNA-binding IclR family transcriptional regulator